MSGEGGAPTTDGTAHTGGGGSTQAAASFGTTNAEAMHEMAVLSSCKANDFTVGEVGGVCGGVCGGWAGGQ